MSPPGTVLWFEFPASNSIDFYVVRLQARADIGSQDNFFVSFFFGRHRRDIDTKTKKRKKKISNNDVKRE